MARTPESATLAGGIVIVMVIVFIIAIVGIAWFRAMQGGL